jgi:hypothetical protein
VTGVVIDPLRRTSARTSSIGAWASAIAAAAVAATTASSTSQRRDWLESKELQ